MACPTSFHRLYPVAKAWPQDAMESHPGPLAFPMWRQWQSSVWVHMPSLRMLCFPCRSYREQRELYEILQLQSLRRCLFFHIARPSLKSYPLSTPTYSAWRSWFGCLKNPKSWARRWRKQRGTTFSPTSQTSARPAKSKRSSACLGPVWTALLVGTLVSSDWGAAGVRKSLSTQLVFTLWSQF